MATSFLSTHLADLEFLFADGHPSQSVVLQSHQFLCLDLPIAFYLRFS